MQNPEEDILKRLLQDTFSDYEPEPSEQTWENIRFAIQPDEPRLGGGLKRFIFPVVALLLLLGSVLMWKDKNENKVVNSIDKIENSAMNSGNGIRTAEKSFKRTKVSEVSKVSNNEVVIANVYQRVNTEIHKNKILIVDRKTPYSEEVGKLLDVRQHLEAVVALDEKAVKTSNQTHLVNLDEKVPFTGTVNSTLPTSKKSTLLETENPVLFISKNGSFSETGNPTLVISETDNSAESQEVSVKKNAKSISEKKQKKSSNINFLTQVIEEPKVFNKDNGTDENHIFVHDAIIEQVRYTKPVGTLQSKDLVLGKVNFTKPNISSISSNKEVPPIRRAIYLSVSITPLQTYRILTVNGRGIQNLQKNGLFDAERNGYAFEVGLTKPIGNTWNFRTNASYLKMRQWAEYQVYTDELLVKNVAANNSVVQIGQNRTESKTLEMVGLKADIQKFLGISGRNRYFVATGTQLMYEPTNRQTNVFLNASAGFQHIIDKNCFLTVEPSANYLLNNTNEPKSLIQSSAYNLGLKIGLNFKVQ